MWHVAYIVGHTRVKWSEYHLMPMWLPHLSYLWRFQAKWFWELRQCLDLDFGRVVQGNTSILSGGIPQTQPVLLSSLSNDNVNFQLIEFLIQRRPTRAVNTYQTRSAVSLHCSVHSFVVERVYFTFRPKRVSFYIELMFVIVHKCTERPNSGEKGRLCQLFPKCFRAFPFVGLIFNTS